MRSIGNTEVTRWPPPPPYCLIDFIIGYTLSVNHLADKNELELKVLRGKIYTGGYNGGAPFPYRHVPADELPSQFDWRILGAVSPVKGMFIRNLRAILILSVILIVSAILIGFFVLDQSVCGSCWSFGTVGAIEGAYFLKTGKLTRFSQQALIDCSWG